MMLLLENCFVIAVKILKLYHRINGKGFKKTKAEMLSFAVSSVSEFKIYVSTRQVNTKKR